jgi:hypothetical protein
MPMVTPQPDAPDFSTTHRVETVRGGDGSIGSAASLPEELLPLGGTDHREAAHDLAEVDIVFRLEVEVIRHQLAPVRSRLALASSYGREAGHRAIAGAPSSSDRAVTPLQVAYAMRWLELATPGPVPVTWSDLLDSPLD